MFEFKSHPIYNKYSANVNGDIIGIRGKLLTPILHRSNYMVLGIHGKQYRWHRFVWECHHGVIQNKDLVINHKDGNKINNILLNLELVTHSRNAQHALELGLRTTLYGEDTGMSKLTKKECLALILLSKEKYSDIELSKFFGIHYGHVAAIRRADKWKKLHEEYHDLINS